MDFQSKYIDKITDKLKLEESIKNVYLFGSYASGNPDKNSDIDLLVILKREGFLKKYEERIGYRTNLYKVLYDINKKIAIDILVYTPEEWQLLKTSGGSFHREIRNNSIKLI